MFCDILCSKEHSLIDEETSIFVVLRKWIMFNDVSLLLLLSLVLTCFNKQVSDFVQRINETIVS